MRLEKKGHKLLVLGKTQVKLLLTVMYTIEAHQMNLQIKVRRLPGRALKMNLVSF